jgi:hypothetical protein
VPYGEIGKGKVIPWSKIILQNLVVAQTDVQAVMELCSQNPDTCPYSRPPESSPQLPILFHLHLGLPNSLFQLSYETRLFFAFLLQYGEIISRTYTKQGESMSDISVGFTYSYLWNEAVLRNHCCTLMKRFRTVFIPLEIKEVRSETPADLLVEIIRIWTW